MTKIVKKSSSRKLAKNVNPRRQYLIHMSVKARTHIKKMLDEAKTDAEMMFWSSLRINDVLAMWYKESTGATDFKTFNQWKEEGYNVKKGEKAFVLWSKKRQATAAQEENKNEDPESYEFFPIAYLFSDLQVEKQTEEIENEVEEMTEVGEPSPSYSRVTEITVNYRNPLKPSEMPQIKSSFGLNESLRPFFSDCMEHHEEFYIMLLNRANRCLGVSKISQGGTGETVVDPKIIFQIALKANASSIALCHNHPSGNMTPSSSDDMITRKIKDGCSALGLNLIDHIVLSSEAYYSYVDEGRL